MSAASSPSQIAEDANVEGVRVRHRRSAFEDGQRAWPNVCLSFAQFCEHLDRVGREGVARPHAAAFYLCAACALGSLAAVQALEERYLSRLARVVARLGRCSDSGDDLLQDVRARLLVGPGAKIATYTGDGSLSGWLSRVVRHLAVDKLRSSREDRTLAFDVTQAGCAEPGDLESERWTRALERSLAEAVASLNPKERRLLVLFYVEEVNAEDLGAALAVDRSTVYRRLQRCMIKLRQRVQAHLPNYFGPCSRDEMEIMLHDFHFLTVLDVVELLQC